MRTLGIIAIMILSLRGFAQARQSSFRATDGSTYYLHSDGKYYDRPAASNYNSRRFNFAQTMQHQRSSFRGQNGQMYYLHSDGRYYARSSYLNMHGQHHRSYNQQQVPSCYKRQQFSGLNNFRQFNQHQVTQSSGFQQRLQSLAKKKANILANHSPVRSYRDGSGVMRYSGNIYHPTVAEGLGGAGHEGVGYSNVSAQAAIDKCCHSGHCTSAKGPGYQRLATAVTKGQDGIWYACILTK